MYIKVRVVAGSRKEKITQINDAEYQMIIKEPAKNNLANNKIKDILANEMKVERGKVRLITGHQSPSKIFDVNCD
jgi:uncharacterized protein YggU (UPF0235/DUF167 family)